MVFLSFFFQVPLWCHKKGKDILGDCIIDEDRVEYYTTKLLTLSMKQSMWISWVCEFILIANQLFGIMFATQKTYIIRVLCLSVCLVADIITGLLLMNRSIQSAANAYFKIAFIMIYSQTLRKGMVKLIRSLKETFPAIIMLVLNITVFSGIAYVLFYGTLMTYFRHS